MVSYSIQNLSPYLSGVELVRDRRISFPVNSLRLNKMQKTMKKDGTRFAVTMHGASIDAHACVPAHAHTFLLLLLVLFFLLLLFFIYLFFFKLLLLPITITIIIIIIITIVIAIISIIIIVSSLDIIISIRCYCCYQILLLLLLLLLFRVVSTVIGSRTVVGTTSKNKHFINK